MCVGERGVFAALSCALAVLVPHGASAQDPSEEWLRRVMPEASRFSERDSRFRVFEAYARGPSSARESLVGYVFLTSDLPPEQMGFSGPIEVLVGMDLRGVLTGIVVTDYRESHRATRGDFLAAEGFQEQFRGKSMFDPFQVRRDVDGISGATITVDAMARGVRNAARDVALAYRLGPLAGDTEAPLDPVSVTLAELERLSWTQMLLRGLVQRISILDGERVAGDLTLLYLRDAAVAEALMGPEMWGQVLERAGPRAVGAHLVLAGVDGPDAGSLNLARLSIVQGTDTVGLTTPDVLLFGPPREGKLDGQVRMLRVLLFERVVDMTRPFTFVLDLRPGRGVFSAEYSGERPVVARREGTGDDVRSARMTLFLALLILLTAAYVKDRRRRALHDAPGPPGADRR